MTTETAGVSFTSETHSRDLFARALEVTPGGVHSPVRGYQSVGGEPIFFARGEGPYLYSVEGERYIDFCQSFGPLILGHRDSDVQTEVEAAIQDVWTVGACEPYSLALADWINTRVPAAEKLRFTSSGTEAVMSALRLARAATGREKVLKFEGCYHGHVDSLLVQAGSGLAGTVAASSAGIGDALQSQTVVTHLDDEVALDAVLEQWGGELAAVIVEPLPANNGLLIQRTEYLEYVAKRAKDVGALLVFDEVISGFRTQFGGMAERLDIVPDLVTYGKVLGGGFPVGCYAGKAELMDLVAPVGPVYQAGTLSGNPIGMRAGLATLQKVERESVHATLRERADRFASGFRAVAERGGYPVTMTQIESLFWIHPRLDGPPRRPDQLPDDWKATFAELFNAFRMQKIFFAPNGFEVGFLGHAHTDAVLDEALDGMEKALHEVFD